MTGLFFANFTAIGGILILGDIQMVNIWASFTLFGFLLGGGFCYLIRASSVSTCKAVCQEMINEKEEINNYEPDETRVGKERLIDKEDKFA